ncbi:hypothetical protein [Haloferula sp. BvORR071]|uniref:hypothetical protein n=1 Tax=Haloferula sp. BvORR071 TaxID=1396141 RepID=UPI00224100EB|nr:hypothetical protein [Haloferula sp. BvORR071]
MKIPPLLLLALATGVPLHAGTVVVTSLPGDFAAPQSLRSFRGLPLGPETTIQLGAFPAMSDDQVLDLATGGYSALLAAWLPFGTARSMGEGAGDQEDSFEIAVQQDISASALAGQEISILIRNGQEFLVARFKAQSFAADTETGLEQVATLQLRDAKMIVGNRLGPQVIATSTTPAVGSYGSWMAAYAAAITDETLREPEADADGDGLSNFLEYATGGNPVLGADSSVCRISEDEIGHPWFSFRSQPGLGGIGLSLGSSPDLQEWSDFAGDLEWDPSPPDAKSWLRTRIPATMPSPWFFRLELDE